MDGAWVKAQEAVYGPGLIIHCSYKHVLPCEMICYLCLHLCALCDPFGLLPPTSTAYMRTYCFCDKCYGTIVSIQTKLNHQRKQLKTEMISGQLYWKCENLPGQQHSAESSSSLSPVQLCLPPGIPAPSLVPGTPNDPGSLTQVSIKDSELDTQWKLAPSWSEFIWQNLVWSECSVHLSLYWKMIIFQMRSKFLCIESEWILAQNQLPSEICCVLLHYTETFKGFYFSYRHIQTHYFTDYLWV